MKHISILAMIFTILLAIPTGVAMAHAFPEHQVPGAGAVLKHPPKVVSIRFDRAVEPAFSSLHVKDAAGRRVDVNNMHAVSGRNDTLEVSLKALASGRYHVFWRALARDGHRTYGDYTFTVRKGAP